MKNYEQLLEDARSDRELAEAVSRAMQDYMRTDDRAALVTRLAEKGYEVTEKDIEPPKPADGETPFHDLTNISDDELKDVTGGVQVTGYICSCGSQYLRRTGYYRKGVVWRTLWPDTEYFCKKCRTLYYWNCEYDFYPKLTEEELIKYDLDRADTDNYQAIYKG